MQFFCIETLRKWSYKARESVLRSEQGRRHPEGMG